MYKCRETITLKTMLADQGLINSVNFFYFLYTSVADRPNGVPMISYLLVSMPLWNPCLGVGRTCDLLLTSRIWQW